MFFGSGGIIKALDTVSRGVRSGCIRCMTDEQQVEFLNDTIKYLESYITKRDGTNNTSLEIGTGVSGWSVLTPDPT